MVKFTWNNNSDKKLLKVPDKVVYECARRTLDLTYTKIPLSNRKYAGKLRQSTMAGGVKGSNGIYSLGSYTSYAKYVYNMRENAHWTTPGTNNKWFERTWKEKGSLIKKQAIERNLKK